MGVFLSGRILGGIFNSVYLACEVLQICMGLAVCSLETASENQAVFLRFHLIPRHSHVPLIDPPLSFLDPQNYF